MSICVNLRMVLDDTVTVVEGLDDPVTVVERLDEVMFVYLLLLLQSIFDISQEICLNLSQSVLL